jgi:hypothetical protein
MTRLATAALATHVFLELGAGTVSVPAYGRVALRPGVAHIGVGGFHRAALTTQRNGSLLTPEGEFSVDDPLVADGVDSLADEPSFVRDQGAVSEELRAEPQETIDPWRAVRGVIR